MSLGLLLAMQDIYYSTNDATKSIVRLMLYSKYMAQPDQKIMIYS
jgi:hypothetical protein